MERHPVYRTAYNLLGLCKGMDKHLLETIGKKAINLSYDIVLGLKMMEDALDKNQS